MPKTLNQLYSALLNNGVNPHYNFDQAVRIRISNAISIVGSLFAFGYSVFLFAHGQHRMAINDLLFIANMLALFFFNRFGYVRFGPIFIFITIPVSLLLVNYEYGRIGTEYYYYAMIVLSFYYFQKPLNRYLTSAYLVLLIILTKHLETGVVHTEFTASIETYILYSNVFMSLAILFLSVTLFVSQHTKYQLEIEDKNNRLNAALIDVQQKHEQVNLVLRELNHRVKNNLQMVSSLFNIQSYKTRNLETKEALNDARNRIVSIAIMHQKLYKDNLFHEVPLKKYVIDLVEYLKQSVSSDDEVEVNLNVADIKLRIEDTVHVGLIVNELVTNSIKYGANREKGKVEIGVEVKYGEGALQIMVTDTGIGFYEGFVLEKSDSFGLELVDSIARQHEGNVLISNGIGAKIEIDLKITEFRD